MIRDFTTKHRPLTAAFLTYNTLAVALLSGQLDTLTFWAVLFAFVGVFIAFVALAIDSLIDSHHRATQSQGALWLGRPELGRTRRGWPRQAIGAARHGVPGRGKD